MIFFVQNGCESIALESLQLYFSLDPPVNQFLIRAHLCKAMLIADVDNTLPSLTEVSRKRQVTHTFLHLPIFFEMLLIIPPGETVTSSGICFESSFYCVEISVVC